MAEKAKDWDRLDARAVLAELRLEVDGLARPLGLECVRAVPRIDGSLYFDLEPGGLRLDWTGQEGEGEARRQVVLAASDRTAALVPELAVLLDGLVQRPGFALLAFYNQALPGLAFDETVVDTLLADRLALGRTRWFDYTFEEVSQETSQAFRLSFLRGDGRVRLEVRAPSCAGDGQVLLRTPQFAMALLDDCRSPAERRLVSHQIERFLGFLLARSVHTGLVLQGGQEGSARRGEGGQGREPVSVTRWGNPLQWRQFFADFEIERSGLCSLQFSDPVAFVLHGEAECIGVEPQPFTERVGFANLPWPQARIRSAAGSRSFFTGLNEEDAILGGTGKLERALEAALAVPGARFVCLNNTCLPKIIGDDAPSVVRRLSAPGRPPVLGLNTDLDAPDKSYRDLVRQALEASRARAALDGAPSGGLNLVGFPLGDGREEVAAALEQVGIRPNVWLVPEFGFAQLERYHQAHAGLLYPHAPWWILAEQVLTETGIPLARGPAPFGLSGMRTWVEAALAAVEAPPERIERWLEERLGPTSRRWQELRKAAEQHTLGFVVSPLDVERLLRPERMYGVPLLALLSEMGFGLQVLVLGDERARESAEQELTGAAIPGLRLRLESFTDQARLESLLRESSAPSFYSEVTFDSRLTRTGKSQFHLRFFEPGLDGGLRSLERLLHLCRWTFYPRYSRYLMSGEKP